MICPKCGSAEEDGSVFCGECGGALQPPVAAPPPASPPPPPYPGGSADDRKKGGGVFSSPAGIALVVIVGIAVVAGIVFGIILLTRNGSNDQDQEQTQYVTCPNCNGAGTVEGGDGRYVCGFCNGAGTVTSAKAATYNPADWRDY